MLFFQFLVTAVLASLATSLSTEYFGRFNSQLGAHAQWPGTGVNFVVVNNENEAYDVTVQFYDCTGNCKFFVLAEVNCAYFKKFEISAATQVISFQTTLPIGSTQEYRFTKITESSNGDATGIMNIDHVSVNGATFVNSEDFKSACPKPYKMIVIGDSITAGYGVDGTSPCSFSASSENVLDSYASIVAKSIGATAHILPWSGKGVVRNYGDVNQMSVDPMPVFYNRTIATAGVSSDNYWDPSLFIPDVVLVMLGTNDYSTQPNPSDAQFTQGLIDLLSVIQRDYPAAKIAAMCAPMRAGNQCTNIQAATAAIGGGGATYIDIPVSTTEGGWGCNGHPNLATQQNMADYVTPIVRKMLGI